MTTITAVEYQQWLKELGREFLGQLVSDEEGEKLRKRYSEKLAEVTKDIKYKIVLNDWKAQELQFKEVAEVLNEFGGGHIHHFPAFYGFENGEVDSLATVITKEKISNELAEIIVDLIMNLGAED